MTTLPLRLCVRRTPPPPEPARGPVRVSLRLPSDVACIEEAVNLVVRHCLAGASTSPRMRFRLQVALSEALANAVIRGNCEDCSKQVAVQAEIGPDTICIHVTDEGEGFDPRHLPDATCPEALEAPNGRGLFLIRHLVDDVHFNSRGNSICMTLRRR